MVSGDRYSEASLELVHFGIVRHSIDDADRTSSPA